MIMELKRRLIKITNLYFIFVLFGCAYYSMAGSIPPNIRNVSVPLFVNQTPEFELSEKLTNVIIEQISDLIKKIKPNIIFMPNINDIHTDHQIR